MATPPNTTKSMMLKVLIPCFRMIRIIQRFRDQVPLKSSAVTGIYRTCFIRTPTHGTAIDDALPMLEAAAWLVATAASSCSWKLVWVIPADTQMGANDVIAGRLDSVIGPKTSASRSGRNCD